MSKCLFMRKGETHTVPSGSILASDLAVGSTVKLMENGSPVDYLVVHSGRPSTLYDTSCDGLWLLRKDIHSSRVWDSTNNDYANSDIHTWLNRTFFNLLGSIEQSVIKQVKIPYHKGTGYSGSVASGSSGLSVKCFLLGCYELGLTTSANANISIDGATLSYFSGIGYQPNAKRIGYYNGVATVWHTRTPNVTTTTNMFGVGETGGDSGTRYQTSYGVRPALILPSTAQFDSKTLVLKGVA